MIITDVKRLVLSACLALTGLSGSALCSSEYEAEAEEPWYLDAQVNHWNKYFADEQRILETTDVNLIWLSKGKVGKNQFVFPTEREKLEVAPYIEDWVKNGYKVKFWYDSTVSTQNQVNETLKLFSSITDDLGVDSKRLKLVDIWTVPSVQKRKKFFLNSEGNVPIYFRADMIRLMISSYQISDKGNANYSLYADMNVKAVPISDLIASDHQELKKHIGMVVARGGVKLGMKNAFHIFSR